MSRRLSILATVILLLLSVVAVQAANIQFFKASALNASPLNPRLATASNTAPRGDIVAADGTVLAHSVSQSNANYPYRRIYPLGSLTSGVVGFSGPAYGNWGLEREYDSYLSSHTLPPQSFAQVLAPISGADSLDLTLYPSLQRVARTAMKGVLGAAVVLDPKNGDVLGMYSNPNYNPTPLTSTTYSSTLGFVVAKAAWHLYNKPDQYGISPLNSVAVQETFPPGSTFKVITASAAVAGKPILLQKVYPDVPYISLPDSNLLLHNSGGGSCGGTIADMLPPSCDPGFASVGLDLGQNLLAKQANLFGYNETPPIDLPIGYGGAVASYFPPAASFVSNQAGLAYSAIGQENVRATALQDALEAAAVGNHGVEMAPHLMSAIIGPDGQVVKRFTPTIWKKPLTAAQAAQVVPWMQNVVKYGTAYGVFNPADNVAAKTGTAQTGNPLAQTDDWMIAFAPANDPTVAVAVVMPYQLKANFGATVAGPIANCLVEDALAIQTHKPVHYTSSLCAG